MATAIGFIFFSYREFNYKLSTQSTKNASKKMHFKISAVGSRSSMRRTVDALSSQEKFNVIFPGYNEDVRTDINLWRRYFNHEFETKVAINSFSYESLYGVTVTLSWTGCLEIIKKYGVDVLLLGSSETAQALPPDLFSQHLPGNKILVCATPALTLDSLNDYLLEIDKLKLKSKIKLLVYNYNLYSGFSDSIYYQYAWAIKKNLLGLYRNKLFLGDYSYLNQKMGLPFSWQILFPVNPLKDHLPLENNKNRIGILDTNNKRWSILRERISLDMLKTQKGRRSILDMHISNYFSLGTNDDSCTWGEALGDKLKRFKEKSRQLADRVFLFRSPTLGNELKDFYACHGKTVSEHYKRIEGDGLELDDSDISRYNLTIEDFIFSGDQETQETPGRIFVDSMHVNIYGARKIIGHLGEELKRQFPELNWRD
ncbi:MAG: hypothetical protein ACXVLQ_18255 [Bacteriovorax sp.]